MTCFDRYGIGGHDVREALRALTWVDLALDIPNGNDIR